MPRAIILLLDSFGIGATHDADKYHDVGANTFGHISEYCLKHPSSRLRQHQGAIYLPHLERLGLFDAAQMSSGKLVPQINKAIIGKYGFAEELSHGKETPSGHWEIAGVPVLFNWGYFPPEYPSFPAALIDEFVSEGELPGILGNRHASGTEIIQLMGREHMESGKPIVYTSGDSVFQIAVHEETFGLDRLYRLCQIARRLVDPYNIGRVIARPFIGEPGNFQRTANRRDYAMPPPALTLLDKLVSAGGKVIAIGKTADIFAHQGISREIRVYGNMDAFDKTLASLRTARNGSLIFTNFVDFDSLYGHRRDVEGYAAALEAFDRRLPELDKLLKPNDVVIITADHGCDPTWPGSDHTRENIPVLAYGPGIKPENIGRRSSFADIGQSLAQHFKLEKLLYGTSFFD